MTRDFQPRNRKAQTMTDPAAPAPSRLSDALDRLTDAQRKRVSVTARAVQARIASPPMRLSSDGDALVIQFPDMEAEVATLLQMADIGTTDPAFHAGLVGQIACLGAHRRAVDADSANFLLSVVRAVQPRDELEAMLATQMGAIHAATMMLARKLNHVTTLPQQDSAERALNKLARTYATQMETLKRYRTGGQQKVTVEHVTVNAGGQAIVGAVEAGGGGRK